MPYFESGTAVLIEPLMEVSEFEMLDIEFSDVEVVEIELEAEQFQKKSKTRKVPKNALFLCFNFNIIHSLRT